MQALGSEKQQMPFRAITPALEAGSFVAVTRCLSCGSSSFPRDVFPAWPPDLKLNYTDYISPLLEHQWYEELSLGLTIGFTTWQSWDYCSYFTGEQASVPC